MLENLAQSIHTVSHYSQNPLSLEVSFIGREQELAAIDQNFRDPQCRVLTLTGIGGVGKTRLAWEAGARIASNFRHGSYFIPLASIASPTLIVPTLATSLGYFFHGNESPETQLLNFLRQRELLLVLDNFEHLMDGANLISELVQTAPDIRVLITSRERLNLREEWVLDISGLDYPDNDDDSSIEAYSAIQLFLQTARRVKADFQLTKGNQSDVIRICRQVEGMPLGIELAASWLRALSCRAIGDEIERSFDFLTSSLRNIPEKHRSIRAVFAHSYHLLTPEQQQTFGKLSVFRGGFTRESARAVAGTSLATLTALIDKSLLRVGTGDRYEMHELLRQYADEQLEASGIGDEVRYAYAVYFAGFVYMRVEDLKGRRQPEALAEINADFENVRTAWNWAASHKQKQIVAQMIEGLSLFCKIRNHYVQAQVLFRYAEQQFATDRDQESVRLWGRLLAQAAEGESYQRHLETALQIARRYDDQGEVALCLEYLGEAACNHQNYDQARQLVEQSIVYYRRLGDLYYVARALNTLHRMDPERNWESYKQITEECLRIRRAMNDKAGIAAAVVYEAMENMRVGNFSEAEQFWYERITLGQEVGSLGSVALGYAHLSYTVYFYLGDFVRARAAAERAIQLGAAIGFENPASWALTTLGLLASMEESYEEGRSYCQQAASTSGIAWTKNLAAWGMSVADCGQGDYQAAKEHLLTAARFTTIYHGLPGIVAVIGIGAVLLAHEGDSTHAVECLALAFTHPVRASGWLEKWALLTRLLESLKAVLGFDAYSAAWERGRLLDAEAVAAELVQRFQTAQLAPEEKTFSSLTTSLTTRELEILRLIADGLSNGEIAEKLFLARSTVKWYVSEILGKLHAKSRTQAVTRARALKLLP